MAITDRDVMTDYAITLAAGESKIIKISAKIATTLVEVKFPDGTGKGKVYASLESNARVNAVLDGAVDDLDWTLWDLGEVTEVSVDTSDIAYAPNALKFVNTGATNVKFNYRGNFA